MGYPRFVVMLARQRSGTNALREILSSHPAIFCTPEVFHGEPSPQAELEVETNFYRFAERHRLGRGSRPLSLESQDRLFHDYLEFLGCFSEKRLVVLDVKYNSTHALDGPWRLLPQPGLFRIVRRHGIKVFNLRRSNLLRSYLSMEKARVTDAWTATAPSGQADPGAASAGRADTRVTLDVGHMLYTIDLYDAEDTSVCRSFAAYPAYFSLEYEDLFPELGAPVAVEPLSRLAAWLGIEDDWSRAETQYRKLAALGLSESIANYPEVEAALSGGPYEAFLEDERMYRAGAAQATAATTG